MPEYTVRVLLSIPVETETADAAYAEVWDDLERNLPKEYWFKAEPDGDDSVDGPEDEAPAPVKSVEDALRDVLNAQQAADAASRDLLAKLKDLGYEVPDA